MCRKLCLVLCILMMAVSSYNAEFVDDRENKDRPANGGIDRPPRFPLLKPLKNRLKWKDQLKLPVKKIKNKLKHKIALHKLTGGGGVGGAAGGVGGVLGILQAIENYITSSLALLLPNYFEISTTTVTSTSFITCTKSTTVCAGRRRRAIVEDLLIKLSELDNNGTADAVGESNEEYLDSSVYNDEIHYSDPELLEGSLSDPSMSIKTPSGKFSRKDISRLMMVRQLPDDQLAQLLNELGLNTILTTETTKTTSTVTSYPACSSQGTIPQC